MAAEFTAGDMVRVKAAMFRRPGGVFIQRGQVFELNEGDINRSDLDLLVEPVDGPLTGDLVQVIEGEPDEDEAPENIEGDISLEELREKMSKMTIKATMQFLNHESWTLEEMRLALEAEESGRNRARVIEGINNRILDLEDEDDSGAPV